MKGPTQHTPEPSTAEAPAAESAPRMQTRWELTLRGRMLLVLASPALCGAWMTGDDHARLAAALLIAPLLVDVLWRWGGIPPLDVKVAARRTQAGSLFLESVTLRNRGHRRPVHALRVEEPLTQTGAGGAHVDVLEPGQSAFFRVPARVRRRGRRNERVFQCETSYPLGLLRNRALIAARVELVSEPARTALPADPLHAVDDSREQPSPRATRGSQEFYALREYRYGEDGRRVHALRSATAGSLLCTITRGEEEREACLVLDLRRPPGHPAARGQDRFEWSLKAAATLIDEMRRQGTVLSCFVLGVEPRTWTLQSGAECDDMLGYLAEARPSRHALLSEELRERIAEHRSCLWIPAGGHAALEEREGMGRVVVITRERT